MTAIAQIFFVFEEASSFLCCNTLNKSVSRENTQHPLYKFYFLRRRIRKLSKCRLATEHKIWNTQYKIKSGDANVCTKNKSFVL